MKGLHVTLHVLLLLAAYFACCLITLACGTVFMASVATVWLVPERLAVIHWTALILGIPAAAVPGLIVWRLERLLMRAVRAESAAQ